MSQRVVYLSGRFVPEAEARLSIYDSALTMGDMAFEVTRTFAGRPFRLRHHLERLFHSLAAIRVDPGLAIDDFERITLETLERNRPTEPADVDWNIIHNVSRGPANAFLGAFAAGNRHPSVVISCYPLTAKMAALAPCYERGLDLVVPRQPAIPPELFDPTIKTRSRVHYHLANYQAHEQSPGSWAVLATTDGRLTEGTSGNFFLVLDGRLATAPAGDVLEGVTRGAVLEIAARLDIPAEERDVRLAEAATADEVFLTSTSIGILHGRSFNGRVVGDGRPGPVTTRLRAALNEAVGLDFAAQANLYAKRLATGR